MLTQAYEPLWSKMEQVVIDWVHSGPSILGTFLASLVEFVEGAGAG